MRFGSMGTYAPYHSKYLIIGAGDGGVSTATNLNYSPDLVSPKDITLIDPKSHYIYQSGQTMVGSGIKDLNQIIIPTAKRLPSGVRHIQKSVTLVKPDQNIVVCDDGSELSYEYLVLSVGVHPQLDLIKGLREALEDDTVPVATNYIPTSAEKMNRLKKSFKGGKALFTQPGTPIKCAGAPLKIMFLCAYDWAKAGLTFEAKLFTGLPRIFLNPYYLPALEDVAKQYGADVNVSKELIEVKGDCRIAIFRDLNTDTLIEEKFDIMHATPILKPPKFLAESKLTNPNGYVNVNHYTLQHNEYKNIFALGDCADLPTSKTLSAVNAQFHTVTRNLKDVSRGKQPSSVYDGYTACPVLVGGHKVLLAEFGYNNKIMPTFTRKQLTPSRFFYMLKVHLFDKLALYNLCGIIQPIRTTLAKIPFNKHRDYPDK